jgi:hypothetical protein
MNLLDDEIVRDGEHLRGIGGTTPLELPASQITGINAIVSMDGSPAMIVWWNDSETGYIHLVSPLFHEILSTTRAYLFRQNQVHYFVIKNGEMTTITRQLKNCYAGVDHFSMNDTYTRVTTEGKVVRIRLKKGKCTETPVERGAEFDEWLVNDWPLIVSRDGDIVRISKGSTVIKDIEVGSVLVSRIGKDHFAIADGTRVQVWHLRNERRDIYADGDFSLNSPIVQLLYDKVLCEDGTIWELERAKPPSQIDCVSEVIYPRRYGKRPTC